MKISLKIAAAVAATLISAGASAQGPWSITAGYLNAACRASATSSEDVVSVSHLNGFYLGAGYEMPVKSVENFYLEGQLLYSYLGDKSGDTKENIHMLNLPVRGKYKISVNDNLGVFGYAGPLLSYGFAANDKVGSVAFDLYGDDGILNRFDIKLGIGVGAELSNRIVLNIGYDWGLFNISKVDSTKAHIHWLNVGVAYRL